MIRIGITKENIEIGDVRSPFNPRQSKKINSDINFNVEVQSSNLRCFEDNEFEHEGVRVVKKLNNSDIIFGIKKLIKINSLRIKHILCFLIP